MRTPMENAALEAAGRGVARSALAGSLLWVGALKFAEYEAENIQPMVSTSPLFSRFNERLGARKTARLIGLTEIAMGALIAARPLSPRASAIGSLGATAPPLASSSRCLGSGKKGTGSPRSPWRGSSWPRTGCC